MKGNMMDDDVMSMKSSKSPRAGGKSPRMLNKSPRMMNKSPRAMNKSPRAGGGGTTPREGAAASGGGNTTPRSYYTGYGSTTPRGYRGPIPATPSNLGDSNTIKRGDLFKNEELPPEEFEDFLTQLDKQTQPYKSLDDALAEKFDINEVTTIQQRLKNVPQQSYRVKDLGPAPLYLLTKRHKKCKTCSKILVKQSKDPSVSSTADSVAFLLRDIVPRITIYRFSKYTDGQPLDI
jgi:hypothetical protein